MTRRLWRFQQKGISPERLYNTAMFVLDLHCLWMKTESKKRERRHLLSFVRLVRSRNGAEVLCVQLKASIV